MLPDLTFDTFRKMIGALFLLIIFSLGGHAQNLGQLPVWKNDFLVNTISGTHGSDQMYPAVAVDSSGYFCVTWIDKRNGFRQVYAQVFDAQGKKVGHNIFLDASAQDFDSYPLVAASDAGRFVITWSPQNKNVFAQLVGLNGKKIGSVLPISPLGQNSKFPSVAMAPGGRFMVVWQTGFNYFGKLKARLFDKEGQALSNYISINGDSSNARLGQRGVPGVAVDSAGHFAVAYMKQTGRKSNIYLQFIDKQGRKIGGNILISNPNPEEENRDPFIAATRDGVYCILWYPLGGSAKGRLFRFGSGPVGEQFLVKDILNWDSDRRVYSCSSNGRDRFFASFGYLSNQAPRLVSIDTSGTIFSPDTVLHTAQGKAISAEKVYLSNAQRGKIRVVFSKFIHRDEDIYLQEYTEGFAQAGALKSFVEDSSKGAQIHPLAVSNSKGQTLIIWLDRRNGDYQLFGRVYQADGEPLGKDFPISAVKGFDGRRPHFAANAFDDGTFVVAYVRREKGQWSYQNVLYLQRIKSSGELDGKGEPVMQFSDYTNVQIRLSCNGLNGILFYWVDWGEIWHVYGIRFNRTFNYFSKPIKIFPSDSVKSIRDLAISAGSDMNYLMVWVQEKGYYRVVYGQIFSSSGAPLDSAFLVSPSVIGLRKIDCRMISKDEFAIALLSNNLLLKRYYSVNGKSVIFTNRIVNNWSYWDYEPGILSIVKFKNKKLFLTTRISGSTIVGYYLNDNKNIIRAYRFLQFLPVTGYDYFDRDFLDYSTTINGDHLFLTYQSNRLGGTNFDIWAKIFILDSIDFEPEPYFNVRNGFSEIVLQNAPNPFNSRTQISYYLPAAENVTITVYNTLGQKVRTLLNRFQSPGWHNVVFDASGLAAGIYFCRLQGYHTKIIKMVVLK